MTVKWVTKKGESNSLVQIQLLYVMVLSSHVSWVAKDERHLSTELVSGGVYFSFYKKPANINTQMFNIREMDLCLGDLIQ